MARRIEAQFRRDWCFSYTMWNDLFRTSVNLSRRVYAYSRPGAKEEGHHAREDFEHAVVAILNALKGTYKDPAGKVRPVNGDMTMIKYAVQGKTQRRSCYWQTSSTPRPVSQERKRSDGRCDTSRTPSVWRTATVCF